jgi:hypothetical protein
MKGRSDMNEIEQATATLTKLEQKRAESIRRATELKDEQTSLAFAAHGKDDPRAQKRLAEVNRELAIHGNEVRGIDVALTEARKRVASAEAAAAQAEARKQAEAARKIAAEIAGRFKLADEHLAVALKHLLEANAAVEELHMRGFAFPSGRQIQVYANLAMTTWLMKLPNIWWKELADGMRYLAPGERRTFTQFWTAMSTSVARSIDPPPPSVPAKPAVSDKREAAAATREFVGAPSPIRSREGFEIR